jgi:adenosylcobinamide kinase/adenosylcobinamide-phosphate guanylyltransferase
MKVKHATGQGLDLSPLKFPMLVAGPAHSGKSNFVTESLLDHQNVAVIGTADIDDRTMKRHLEGIQMRRPANWEVINEGLELCAALEQQCRTHELVIVDSLNQWIGNLLVSNLKTMDPAQTLEAIRLDCSNLMTFMGNSRNEAKVVLISSEVGACPAPPRIGERIFRQTMGHLNAGLARIVPTVIHVQYGLPQLLKSL